MWHAYHNPHSSQATLVGPSHPDFHCLHLLFSELSSSLSSLPSQSSTDCEATPPPQQCPLEYTTPYLSCDYDCLVRVSLSLFLSLSLSSGVASSNSPCVCILQWHNSPSEFNNLVLVVLSVFSCLPVMVIYKNFIKNIPDPCTTCPMLQSVEWKMLNVNPNGIFHHPLSSRQ